MLKAPKKGVAAAALRASMPVMAGYIVLGMGFGIIMKTKGYGFFMDFCHERIHICRIDAVCGG